MGQSNRDNPSLRFLSQVTLSYIKLTIRADHHKHQPSEGATHSEGGSHTPLILPGNAPTDFPEVCLLVDSRFDQVDNKDEA